MASELTNQFLLGRGKYFIINRDWGGHDNISTYMDICNLLDSEFLSVFDLQTIFGIFWSYFIYRQEEGKLHSDWHISNKIKRKILDQMNMHINNKADLGAINDTIIRIKNRFGYDLLQIDGSQPPQPNR